MLEIAGCRFRMGDKYLFLFVGAIRELKDRLNRKSPLSIDTDKGARTKLPRPSLSQNGLGYKGAWIWLEERWHI